MKNMIFSLLLAAPLLLGGCLGVNSDAQARAAAQRRTFVPEVAVPDKPLVAKPAFESVKCRAVRILAPFDSKQFIHRRSDGQFVADFYNGWLGMPADLVSAQIVRYLDASGLFSAVFDGRSSVSSQFGLECILSEFYVDDTGESPTAAVGLRMLLVDEGAPKLSVRKSVKSFRSVSAKSSAPDDLARAYNQALTECLKEGSLALNGQNPSPEKK